MEKCVAFALAKLLLLLCSCAQGMNLVLAKSIEQGLNLKLRELARMRKRDCISPSPDRDIDYSRAQDDQDSTSLDLEMGTSLENLTHDQALMEISPTPTKEEEGGEGGGGGGDGEEKLSEKKSIFDSLDKTLVTMLFTITITMAGSVWAYDGKGDLKLNSFPFHSFFFIVMLSFYVSLIGIIISNRFPSVARGLYVVAFLCIILSLTLLFGAILPDVMDVVPWIFLAVLTVLVISLVLYENC
ncbi:uncharacterized protein LOC120015959 [Tripterygium wilfordii]|uniref:uncharacterized protein LOC120015959 n=1 Tax=Tripterygium wilfordii TaxID=458696 RepID=UPI0018F8073A|nr:uncharacterized protein LOC120015959 [Tripterygium wilfordii]